MKQKMILIIAVLCTLAFAGMWWNKKQDSVQNIEEKVTVTGDLKVTVLDIGKADCSIFEMGNSVVMIDTGLKDTADDVIEYLVENNITRIDGLIITHFDKDHVGGAAKIMKAVTVKQIIQPDYGIYEKDSKAYNKYVDAAAGQNIPLTTLKEKTQYTWDDAVFTVYPPMKDYYGENEENDFSLVTEIKYGKIRMLFTGDAETVRLQELYAQIKEWNFDIVKMPHHGVYQDGVDDFVHLVNAEYAIVCCSEKKTADLETLAALKKTGTKTFLTQNGTIHFTTDGTSVNLRQE